MEEKHTSGEWKAIRNSAFWGVVTKDSPAVAYAWGNDERQAEANARRIVACVNACASIPTYQLTDAELIGKGGAK